jgi:hypothetical protein
MIKQEIEISTWFSSSDKVTAQRFSSANYLCQGHWLAKELDNVFLIEAFGKEDIFRPSYFLFADDHQGRRPVVGY